MAGTSAAATAPRDPTELLEDRRALITFVLQVYRRQGGRVDYPVGVDGSEQWLLDSLEVPLLLDKVKRDRKLDIIQLCKAAKRASQSGSNSSEGDALPQGPCDGAASHQRMNSLDSAWGHHASQPTLPELESSSVQAGFKEHEIQELAYTLFVVCCGSSSDNVLLQKVRQQLELSGARAGEIQQVLALVDRRGRGSDMGDAVNFQLLVRLLKGVKPGDFRKFKDFARWRNALTHLLVENLHQAAISDQETEMDKGMEEVQARVARLKGAVRRLSVSEAEDFEEEEYTEAGEALEVAAGALAVRCSTGWDFPWQLRTQLWEVLLRASFDNLEENMYIEERDALLERLVGCLAPVLGISPRLHMACSAWVHFKQFVITGDPSVASQAQDLLSALRKDAACQNSFQQNGENERSCSQTVYEKVYVANVEKSVVDWIQKILSDYHQHLPAPENLDSLLNILTEGLESTGVAEEGKVTVVEECICSSTSAAFYRTLESHQGLEGPMKLQAMALSTGQLQETELVKYTAHFAGVCPAAADVAARQLHECYGHIYVPILHQLGSSRVLDPEFIRMCKAADELEQQLLGNCAEEREGLKLWDTMGVVQPHLFRWVNEQMKMLSSWRKRLMEGEDWEPVSATSMVPRSAVEFKKLLTDTVVALFALELPIPMQVIFMLLNSFDEILTSYGQGVVNDLGPLSDLVPPLPPMTRYKKDLAVGAVQGDGGQAKLSGLSKVSKKLTTYFKDPGVVPVVPQIEAEPAHNFVSTLTLNRLVVRINAMQFLRDSLPELESLLQMHYAESSQQQTDNNWPTGVLESAEWSLEQSIGTVCTFLATKLVYWDHRQGWLESVYRHCVDQSRIDPILEALDKELGDSCSQTLPAARNRMAAALMHTSVECFERILLDGGPYRLFTPSDVQLLEHDVLKMRLLFLGDGEGLPQAQVDKAFRPLSELLSVMELATGILIDNFLQVQGCSPTKAANGTGDGEKAFNPEILKKILSHRAERAASKFLKKHFSVPKKLK
eukprot:evm.model.scf_168.3 EVM.evm.TU.scf_168.3   scf_168:17511-22818(+)